MASLCAGTRALSLQLRECCRVPGSNEQSPSLRFPCLWLQRQVWTEPTKWAGQRGPSPSWLLAAGPSQQLEVPRRRVSNQEGQSAGTPWSLPRLILELHLGTSSRPGSIISHFVFHTKKILALDHYLALLPQFVNQS